MQSCGIVPGAQRLVARLDAGTGAITPGWNPVMEGGALRGLTLSPDGSRLYLAGYFNTMPTDDVALVLVALAALP